jgi:hypothetical protein
LYQLHKPIVVMEMDLPTTETLTLPPAMENYEFFMANFNPEPLLAGFDSSHYAFMTKRNRDQFSLSCLPTAECLFI